MMILREALTAGRPGDPNGDIGGSGNGDFIASLTRDEGISGT